MSRAARTVLLLSWLAVLGAAAYFIQGALTISGDLRLFMPAPRTPAERLLLREIGEGPGSRLLLLALSGASPETLAQTSTALATALRGDAHFGLVANGATDLNSIGEGLLDYRYLLTSTFDQTRLDADFLRDQLNERLNDLSSPAASLLEPWIPAIRRSRS